MISLASLYEYCIFCILVDFKDLNTQIERDFYVLCALSAKNFKVKFYQSIVLSILIQKCF